LAYLVQKGDTISEVTNLLKTPWADLRRLNPDAVGRTTRTGHWFLKEGAVIKGKDSFASVLKQEQKRDSPSTSKSEATQSEKWVEYTVKRGDTLWALAVKKFHVRLENLKRDNKIQDPRKLQPGQKLMVRLPSYPQQETVVASWYGGAHHNRPMANGEPFNMYANTIAHKDLPFGTKVELQNSVTGQKARAVVTDRGPYIAGRDVDLSYGLAQKLSLINKGVGKLVLRVLGQENIEKRD